MGGCSPKYSCGAVQKQMLDNISNVLNSLLYAPDATKLKAT